MIKTANDNFSMTEDLYLKLMEINNKNKQCEAANQDDLYRSFRVEAGVYDYDFDDGSIWKVDTIDGVQYLVKVVEDNDEDKVVRQASANKKIKYVDNNNFIDMFLMYYNTNKDLIADIQQNANLRNEMINVLNKKVTADITKALKDNRCSKKADIHNKIATYLKVAAPKTVLDLKKAVDKVCIENI